MSSPARSISSDDEESRELAELKARHEAELRKAAEHKAQKDQERRERREREKREREEREAMTQRIREVGEAVAEVARGLAETDQEQEEREKEALRRMRTSELPTEAEADAREIAETTDRLRGVYHTAAERARTWIEKRARAETDNPWERAGADRSRDAETSEDEEVSRTLKTPRRRVVASRPNTTEVVIVRPVPKGKATDQVSARVFGQGSTTDQNSDSVLPFPV